MPKGGKVQRRFTKEFKTAAVQRAREEVAQGGSMSSVARALGLNPGLLSQWMQAAVSDGMPAPVGETEAQELRRLRREVEVLRMERDFAKKAAAYFARDVK